MIDEDVGLNFVTREYSFKVGQSCASGDSAFDGHNSSKIETTLTLKGTKGNVKTSTVTFTNMGTLTLHAKVVIFCTLGPAYNE